MSKYDSLDAVHIASHGNVGQLFLGSTVLEQSSLPKYADELTNWGNSIAKDGDILLYGCDVAADVTGAAFVNNLSQYIQADIQASVDTTGNSLLGGDWDLEYATGNIEAETLFSDEVRVNYSHTLYDIPLNSSGSYFNDATFTTPESNFVDFDSSLFDSGLRLDYTPTGFTTVELESDPNQSIIDFPQTENQPFSLNFGNPTASFPYYNYTDAKLNHFLHPFDASSLNFNEFNFEFTSVSSNVYDTFNFTHNSITFNFSSGTFDFSSVTDQDSLSFRLRKDNFDTFEIQYDNIVRISDNLLFDATAVTFRSDSVTFDYKPETFYFNPGSFAANANLYEYKLSKADFDSGVTIEQFNASDYRALDYAFEGDEIFDSGHYTNQGITPDGMNPFTDYTENGWKFGLDPHPLFDTSYYLSNNTDVRDYGAEPLKHYITIGYNELNPNRDPHALFDTSYYNENNTDVVNHGMNTLLHYVQFGYSENLASRDPNRFFDSSYYNAKNPDVVAEGVNPLIHYIQFGWRESLPDNPGGTNPNRDPNALFDTEFYFEFHTDVRDEVVLNNNPNANPLQHYLEFGVEGKFANEVRFTHPIFASENQIAFNTVIDAQSENFKFFQNDLNQYGVRAFPQDDGKILIAQAGAGAETGISVEKIVWTVFAGVTYRLLENSLPGTLLKLWELNNNGAFSSYSFTGETVAGNDNTFVFPEATEGEIQIESFPQGQTAKDILDLDSRFYTPLEPIDELANNVESFPQRDRILEDLLNGGLFLGGEEDIPDGVYFLPAAETNPVIQGLMNRAGEPTITKRNTEIYPPLEGGYEEAQRIFNSIDFSNVIQLTNSEFNGFIGILEDGRRIIIRDGSRGEIGSTEPGPPTFEVQRADGKRILRKFRFSN